MVNVGIHTTHPLLYAHHIRLRMCMSCRLSLLRYQTYITMTISSINILHRSSFNRCPLPRTFIAVLFYKCFHWWLDIGYTAWLTIVDINEFIGFIFSYWILLFWSIVFYKHVFKLWKFTFGLLRVLDGVGLSH